MEVWLSGLKHSFAKAANRNVPQVRILLPPQKEIKWGKEIRNVRYTENSDGSGKQTDLVPVYAKEKQIIYPQHQDDEYGEMFLGKRKDNSLINQEHKEFVSKLFTIGNNVVLHHNSSYVIKGGFVKKRKVNGYSNNSDIGIYFWGAEIVVMIQVMQGNIHIIA